MKNTFTRAWYLPEGAKKIDTKDDRFEAYVGDRKHPSGLTYPVGIVFVGKAQKPSFIYRFRSMEEAFKSTLGYVLKMQVVMDDREVAKAKRKALRNVPHTMKVGDILVSSWGYEQTNINFYEVTALRGTQSVVLMEIASSVVRNETSVDYVIPVQGAFLTDGYRARDRKGKELVKRVFEDRYVKISDYEYAYRWEGREMQETAAGWGH